MTTIPGGIFNFVDASYTSPTWSGAEYIFSTAPEVGYGNTKAIWTDTTLIYLATDTTFNLIDIETESLYAYITAPSGGFTAICGNDTDIYIGTVSGTKAIAKTCISGSIENPYDLAICLTDYATSSAVKYIHCNNNLISIITETEISITKFEPNGYTSSAVGTNFLKCFVTPTKLYYTTSGTINRLDYLKCDWSIPHYSYITGSGILASGLTINDIFVTHNTSSEPGHNTLFVATSSGVYIIDEGTGYYSILYRST